MIALGYPQAATKPANSNTFLPMPLLWALIPLLRKAQCNQIMLAKRLLCAPNSI
jgi:hypothetical protein